MPPAATDAYRSQAAQTASGPQLLVMLYERMVSDLMAAANAIDVTHDIYAASTALVHAQQIVRVLRSGLDASAFDGGEGLVAIYNFLEEEMVQANLRKDAKRVRDCLEVIEPLRIAWRQAVGSVERGLATVS